MTNTKPKVSVVIPVLNDAKQAEKTVALLAEQQINDQVEVVLVDDGSSIPIQFEVKATENFDFKILNLPKNSGRSIAINEGVKVSSGEFITLLDVDCEPEHDFLRSLLDTIESDVDVISGHIQFFNKNRLFESLENDVQNKRSKAKDSWYIECTSANLTVKRSLFEKVNGFCSDFTRYGFEDRDFLIRLKSSTPELRYVYAREVVVSHVDDVDLDTYLNKFFKSGRYSAKVFRTRHPVAYSKMQYAAVDKNTSKLFKLVPNWLLLALVNLTLKVARVVFEKAPNIPSFQSIILRIVKGMAFLKGTILENMYGTEK